MKIMYITSTGLPSERDKRTIRLLENAGYTVTVRYTPPHTLNGLEVTSMFIDELVRITK